MKILVRAKPGAKREFVKKIGEREFSIAVREPPKEGMANEAIARSLADYFEVPRADVRLISGLISRQKIFEIS